MNWIVALGAIVAAADLPQRIALLRTMEEWLGASVGSSRCCSVCGTSECRTVEVEGTTFETIPETLFLRAALVASSQLLSVDSGTPA